jgi:hypothetical protein
MANKTKRNFWLDVTIFVAFLITGTTGFLLWRVIPHDLGMVFLRFPRSFWITFHIYSGMVSLSSVVMHVTWHWDWLKALRGRSLYRMPKKLRANRITDRIMWIAYINTNVTGAFAWGIHLGSDMYVVTILDRLHVVVGLVFTCLVMLHLVLHWKWIASTSQRYIAIGPVQSG